MDRRPMTADRGQTTADDLSLIRIGEMAYKFEHLEVWRLALEYLNHIYGIAEKLPSTEDYNLKSQMIRAGTGTALNIAEGSTSQSNSEQARFLGFAIRSLIETVACQKIIGQRGSLKDPKPLEEAYQFSEKLFAKLQAFRNTLVPASRRRPMDL
jgi:four helix bundle protein